MEGKENVKIISYKGYWHLYRRVNNAVYLGFADHRIGLSIKIASDLKDDLKTRGFKEWVSYKNNNGQWVGYWDEPYTEGQIESFGKLTEEELKEWVKIGI